MHISYLFHLCIRGDVQRRNAVLMCISSLIKPQINLIYGRYLHQPHCGPVLNTISLHISPISVSMATYEFDKHSLLFTCLPNPFLIGSETKMIKSDLQLWRELFHKVRQCFRASFTHAQGLRGDPLYSRQEKMSSTRTGNFVTLIQPFLKFCAIFRLSKAPQTLLHALYCHCRRI